MEKKYVSEELPIPLGCLLKNIETEEVVIINTQDGIKDYIAEKEMQQFSSTQTNLFSLKKFLVSQNLREKFKFILNQESIYFGIQVIDVFDSAIFLVFQGSGSLKKEKILFLSIYLKFTSKNKKSRNICNSLEKILSFKY